MCVQPEAGVGGLVGVVLGHDRSRLVTHNQQR
jgi:hypothetical protein